MSPTDPFPPGMPFTVHVTALLESFVTATVNCCVVFARTVAVPGVRVSEGGMISAHPPAAMLRIARNADTACERRQIDCHMEKPPDPAHRKSSDVKIPPEAVHELQLC